MPMIRSSSSASSTIVAIARPRRCGAAGTRLETGRRSAAGRSGSSVEACSQDHNTRGASVPRSAPWPPQPAAVNGPGFLVHVIHQHVSAKGPRRREVRLAVADLSHAAHEADEIGIPREHERVDQDPGLAARGNFAERFRDDERVETEGVAVDSAVGARQRRRFAVGDHDDLTHVLALPFENAAREPQPLARVRVVRAHPDPRELAEGDLFRRVVKEHDLQRIAWILEPDEVGERERDALRGRESILAVENHAVAAVEHEDRRARALILTLHDHQIFVVDLDGGPPDVLLAPHGVEDGAARVDVHRVAEFVRLGCAAGFDPGRHFPRVVTPEAALADRSEQIPERLVAQEVEALVRDLEADAPVAAAGAAVPPAPAGWRPGRATR